MPYNPELRERAREMRKNMTEAEKKLWKEFLQKYEYKVLRQKPIDNYIVDFYLPEKQYVIEVDGGIHDGEIREEYDQIRTNLLEKYGIKVIRFTNEQIFNNIDTVKIEIKTYISSSPLFVKEGLGEIF